MDNHPIPQDVTGFQFRLIGDMTIKQFAYLAAGVVLAWISLSLPVFILIKLPLIVFFAGSGVILAFIPLAGRPADSMIFYFFKAVFSPTQYTYKSSDDAPTPTTTVDNQPEKKEEKREEKEEKVQLVTPVDSTSFQKLFEEQKPQEIPTIQLASTPIAPVSAQSNTTNEETNQQELSKEAVDLAKEIAAAKQQEGAAHDQKEAEEAHEKVGDLESQLQSIRAQKQELETKLLELQKQLSQKPQQVFTPSSAPTPKITENVRQVAPGQSKIVGAPFVSDTPNLICGVVKDPRGNVLPNILIEVKDKDENPVRAFKTNPLGQFASATPVINGTYTLTFEDPNSKQRFDTIELQAIGDILQPLEVISIDAREDLRKELFG